jgi:DHA1 family tetracycline resistance protein-like MFS transporter
MKTLFLIVFIDLLGFGIVIPLLPFYGEHFDATPDVVALLMATYSMTQLVSAPFWGRLSDRIGRRPVLLMTLPGAIISYSCLGFADSLWMLFAARAFGGVMAGNIAAAFAYVADITGPEDRAKGMGVIGAEFGLGFIAGPAIGGILGGADPMQVDFQTPALAAAALSAIALIMTLAVLPESLPAEVRAQLASATPSERRQRFRAVFRTPGIGLLMAISFLTTFVFAGAEATTAMWTERQYGWGPQQNGYLFAFLGIVSAAIQGGLIGRLTRYFGETRLIMQGAAVFAIGMFLIPFSATLPILLVAVSALAYGFSVITPALNSLISRRVGATEQGAVLGAARSVTTLARVVGPAWAGVLFAGLGRHWPYFGGAVVMAVVLFLAVVLVRHAAAEVNRD